MKWCPKQLCIMTQSTAPGKLISVARKTMSSPCNVVMDLWTCMRCDITCSREPCHLQLAPGQGQEYGLNSQVSSWSVFSVCRRERPQPEDWYRQGNMTVEATFSMAKLRILPPSWPRHVGQQVSLGRHDEQTKWPAWHCKNSWKFSSNSWGRFQVFQVFFIPVILEAERSQSTQGTRTGMLNLGLSDWNWAPHSSTGRQRQLEQRPRPLQLVLDWWRWRPRCPRLLLPLRLRRRPRPLRLPLG